MWLEAPESIMYVEDGERFSSKAWHLLTLSVGDSSSGFFSLGGEMLCYLRRVDISSSCFLIQCSSRWYLFSQYEHNFFSNFFFLDPEPPSEDCWFDLGFESTVFWFFFFDFPFACTLEESVTKRAWSLEVWMTPIRINLSCSLIKDSKKESQKGSFQSRKLSRLEWNIETYTEYSRPSLLSMERTFCSSFRSIPYALEHYRLEFGEELLNSLKTVGM